MIGLQHYMVVSAILFVMGVLGIFINRKNVIIILMAIELILLSVNINLVAFSAFLGDLVGQVFSMFVLTVAAGEAAIGLAITFGVMRVINMAHGEFIMMGAYTGYVIQLIVPSYTVSILLAIPAAFCVTFIAGVAMERLVIRHLYKRPLETLLATFGISIALQQIAKNIFGEKTHLELIGGMFLVLFKPCRCAAAGECIL